MTTPIHTQVESFCRDLGISKRDFPIDHEKYFQALSDQGWLAADWPRNDGGPDWDRETRLEFIRTLAGFLCPVPPDSVTVAAPLLLALPMDDSRRQLLTDIRQAPGMYKLTLNDSDALVMSGPGGEIMLAEPGHATQQISRHGSGLWQLYEWMVGIEHIRYMAQHWDEPVTDEISEMQVEVDAAAATFLRDSELGDLQLQLHASQARLPVFSALFQSLGYYALLDPDPLLSANEPVPFREQRYHLGQLRQLIARNEMLQMDQLYEIALREEDDA